MAEREHRWETIIRLMAAELVEGYADTYLNERRPWLPLTALEEGAEALWENGAESLPEDRLYAAADKALTLHAMTEAEARIDEAGDGPLDITPWDAYGAVARCVRDDLETWPDAETRNPAYWVEYAVERAGKERVRVLVPRRTPEESRENARRLAGDREFAREVLEDLQENDEDASEGARLVIREVEPRAVDGELKPTGRWTDFLKTRARLEKSTTPTPRPHTLCYTASICSPRRMRGVPRP